MPVSTKILTVGPASTVPATVGFTLQSPGAVQTPSALRRLVHPDSTNFPALTYRENPDREFNFFRGRVARHPVSRVDLTATGQVVTTFDRTETDMVVTERWVATDDTASMIGNFLRDLLDYQNNPPDNISSFIRWEPLDWNLFTYDVIIVGVTVGGQNVENPYDIKERLGIGGLSAGGTIANPLDEIDGNVATGLIDRNVDLRMAIVAETAVP